MTPHGSQTLTICVLGVAGSNGLVELFGLNTSKQVTVRAWFNQLTGYSVLMGRPPCLIAVDERALPAELIGCLRAAGHTVVVMPSRTLPRQSSSRRSAEAICMLATGLAKTCSEVPFDVKIH